jgi:site-specific recombinase
MTPPVYATLFVSLACAIIFSAWVAARHLSATRHARAALTTDKQYRGLADEYRRLSDLAITAQEHTDMRLTDISVRIDELRAQIDKLQHILKEVE